MRKHVEETAKLPMRLWRLLCGLTIALIPLNALLHYWGAANAAMVMKILAMIFIPVLIFTRWKFTGGEKKELFIMLGLYGVLIASEILYLGGSFYSSSVFLSLVMAFVLIYGYGEYLGKGLVFWLLIFLYFGTPVYIAADPRLPEIMAVEPASKADLYGTYVIEDTLYGSELGCPRITIDSVGCELTIGDESVGCLRYTKPLENEQDVYAVWQLVPEDAPDTLYRLEVDMEKNKILSCTEDDQLQWKCRLESLPEVKCLDGDWKETGGGYPIRWYSVADPLGENDRKFPVIEPEDLFIYWGDETVTTLTVEEIIGDGEPVLRTLHRNENGNFYLGEIFPEPGVIHTYRIEYLGGAFVLQIYYLF